MEQWLTQQLREPLGSIATQISTQISAGTVELRKASEALLDSNDDIKEEEALREEVQRLRATLEELDSAHQEELQALVQQLKSKPAPTVTPPVLTLQEVLSKALTDCGGDAAALSTVQGAAGTQDQLKALARATLRALNEPQSDDSAKIAALEQDRARLAGEVSNLESLMLRMAEEKSEILQRLEAAHGQHATAPPPAADPAAAQALEERGEELAVAHATLATVQAEFAAVRQQLLEATAENAKLAAEAEKRNSELARLRSHLVQQGEQTADDLLRQDARIKELEGAMADMAARHVEELSNRPINKLDIDPEQLMRDLDAATQKLRETEAINANLEAAVGQITVENQVSVANLEKRTQQRIAQLTAQVEALEAQAEKDKETIESMQASVGMVTFLRQNLQVKEQATERLEAEVAKLQGHLFESLHRLNAVNQADSADVVDRTLVSNLVINLLTARDDSVKTDVTGVLASVLALTPKQRLSIGLDRPKPSFLRSLVFGSGASAPPEDVEKIRGTSESFSELWVQFLLAETRAASAAEQTTMPPPPPPGQATTAGN